MIPPPQSFFLSSELDTTFFTDSESIAKCVELVDKFGDQALQIEFDPWESVGFHGRRDYIQELSKSCKVVRVAADVESSSISTVLQSPGKIAMQRRTPTQAPKIDVAKRSQAATSDALVDQLRSSKEPIGDN